MSSVLIIDDEEKLRNLLARIIRLENFVVTEASNIKAAEKLLAKQYFDVILCDVKLPDGNGVEFVKAFTGKNLITEIILLTAYGNIADGVQAIKNGAFDYITKGDDNDRIIPLLNNAVDKVNLKKRIQQLEEQVGKKYSFDQIIGRSKTIMHSIELAKKVAPTDATVLLLGETGTGKEVFAQAIHNAGKRNNGVFMALNCSAFSKEILESELFGHTAGAFTGAIKDKKGLIEEANNGTLFLDEIGEMPFDLQSKLLRVLETSEFIKVGDTKPTKVNVRIITATNKDLHQMVQQNNFREDLYYRLNVFSIVLPPLRERAEDVPLLVEFLKIILPKKINQPYIQVTEQAISLLKKYAWKGNIRELKNVIERAVILADSSTISVDSLPYEIRFNNDETTNVFDLATIEKHHIQKVLEHTGNNKTETARLLNIGLTTLYRKMDEYHLAK